MAGISYVVRGINAGQIKNMQSAITKYKSNVDKTLNKLKSNVDYKQAFKGKAQETDAENYVEKAIEEIKKLTSSLDNFSQALEVVQKNYEAQNTTVGESAKKAANSFAGKKITTKTGVKGFE